MPVAARCAHFGQCGGCRSQDVEYSQQLAQKAALVESFLKPLGWVSPVSVRPAPAVWFYRNKMEFSFQDVYPRPPEGGGYLRLGLKRRGRWDQVLDISECFLSSPEAPRLLAAVRAWAREEKLEPYNLHRHEGFLRHLVVREGKSTGDRMVLLVTNPGELPRASFVEATLSSYPATTILWGVNEQTADVARTASQEVLHGPGFVYEEVLGRRFRISPHSFFQTNTSATAELYGLIREWLSELRPRAVLDVYCGSGGISLCVADLCERIVGIEEVPSAVADARSNAGENRIANVDFMEGKAEGILSSGFWRGWGFDAAIVDPPRSGLHPHALKAVADDGPPWMIYVSCNPRALARDLAGLAERYELQRASAVDLFPHTEHVETLVLLKKREAAERFPR